MLLPCMYKDNVLYYGSQSWRLIFLNMDSLTPLELPLKVKNHSNLNRGLYDWTLPIQGCSDTLLTTSHYSVVSV